MENANWFYAGTVAVLLPFLVAACYNHPLGVHEWDWISNYFGKLDHLNYFDEQVWWYENVGGRYASNAILSTTNSWYTLFRFRAVFVCIILLFCAAVWYFFKSCFPENNRVALLLSCGLVWIYFAGLTGVYDSIYRYSGILTYQLALILLLFYLGALLRLVRSDAPNLMHLVWIGLLSLVIPGFNEPVAFAGIFFLAVGIAALKYASRKIPLWLWSAALLFAIGTAIALFAPGNFVRMQIYGQSYPIWKATGLSLAVLAYQIADWFANSLILPMSILAVPLMAHLKDKSLARRVHPFIWLIGTLFLLFIIIFPLIYSTRGQSYPERIVDLMFVFFLLGWVGFLGSVISRILGSLDSLEWPKTWKVVSGLCFAWILGQTWLGGSYLHREQKLAAHPIDILEIASAPGQITLDIVTGKLNAYHHQMEQQYLEISLCKTDTCWISPPTIKPKCLYDPDSDRRTKPAGEPYQGSYWNKAIKIVRYH